MNMSVKLWKKILNISLIKHNCSAIPIKKLKIIFLNYKNLSLYKLLNGVYPCKICTR